MRLAAKLTAALMVGVLLVLGAQAVFQVRRISALQERELRDDLVILARAMSAAVSEIWAAQGEADARAFVRRADARRERTTIEMVDVSESGAPPARNGVVVVRRGESKRGWQLHARAPIVVRDEVVATMNFDRRLPEEREYYASILWTQAGTTVAAAVVCGLLALGLGMRFVARPIEELAVLARRVAGGDFTVTTIPRQRDEVGALARELQTMTQRLAEITRTAKEERLKRARTLDQLRHADRLMTVGKIASSMAHELGTPLNVVSGRAAMIASDDDVPREARENAEIIAEQAKRMTQILRELLDFSRREPAESRTMRIEELFAEATMLIGPVADDNDVVIERGGDLSKTVTLDLGGTLQVLTNLMMNAVQAMPEGGKLTLEGRVVPIDDPEDRFAVRGEFLAVSVCDEGVGIPKERVDAIFEPFFTTKGAGSGTGLGLSVCDSIVRSRGGWIDVKSTLGKGSCFYVYLPQGDEA